MQLITQLITALTSKRERDIAEMERRKKTESDLEIERTHLDNAKARQQKQLLENLAKLALAERTTHEVVQEQKSEESICQMSVKEISSFGGLRSRVNDSFSLSRPQFHIVTRDAAASFFFFSSLCICVAPRPMNRPYLSNTFVRKCSTFLNIGFVTFSKFLALLLRKSANAYHVARLCIKSTFLHDNSILMLLMPLWH